MLSQWLPVDKWPDAYRAEPPARSRKTLSLSRHLNASRNTAVTAVARVSFNRLMFSTNSDTIFLSVCAAGGATRSVSWAIRPTLLRVIADRRIAAFSRPCSIFSAGRCSCPAVNSTVTGNQTQHVVQNAEFCVRFLKPVQQASTIFVFVAHIKQRVLCHMQEL